MTAAHPASHAAFRRKHAPSSGKPHVRPSIHHHHHRQQPATSNQHTPRGINAALALSVSVSASDLPP
ncbi:uncharacterized protein SETTUDRAFT_154109 [Exserohilum turcica Et28A]|uniref:Uncharacterized protein n=1 Tax=Exserohilum turcicum (strain 28A) TaxID=671987 RepID=R0IRT7_EXST2|nr:uncharacterized protein SETTUDRAFT_154109 [Exserohilum turcica Et28A]EOA87416.1 hypothetical protein SETTUDRAFT_154109 [Exserohilum turcica Et28A]